VSARADDQARVSVLVRVPPTVAFRASGTLVTVTHSGWSAIRPDHPVRHGEEAAAFLRRMGLWWADQMNSLRLFAEPAP